MLKSIGRVILKNGIGSKIFRKFYFLSLEDGLLHPDLDEDFKKMKDICMQNTMTTIENLYHVYRSTRYIIEKNIPGDFVECGVWKGGNLMMVAMTLKLLKVTDRKIYLYDTFEGMSKPTEKDVDLKNEDAKQVWADNQKSDHNEWCYSALDEVKSNMYNTGYPKENMIFVKGMVEDTLPKTLPTQIALLRCDTDWFESTYHELVHLYPLLIKGGFLVIDDYGHWQGAREAVDQYFKENNINMFLYRIDYSARGGNKP